MQVCSIGGAFSVSGDLVDVNDGAFGVSNGGGGGGVGDVGGGAVCVSGRAVGVRDGEVCVSGSVVGVGVSGGVGGAVGVRDGGEVGVSGGVVGDSGGAVGVSGGEVIVRDGGEVSVCGGGGTQEPTEDSSLSQEELEATQPLVLNTTPIFDVLPNVENLEMEETTLIRDFLHKGCGCNLASGFCSNTLTAEYIQSFRCHCSELTRAELDLALLGQLRAFMNTSERTAHTTDHRHTPSTRQQSYLQFWHNGRRVCRNTFKFLHTISAKRLRNLRASLFSNGLIPRCHGNTRRLPANTISFVDTQRVINFLTTYAEANAILLPGRIPGYKRTDVQLLPSCTTRRRVWLQYCASLQSSSEQHHQVAYSTFCSMWRRIVPHIIVTKPMSDLCWICQSNSIDIMRAANHPEEDKSEVITSKTVLYLPYP